MCTLQVYLAGVYLLTANPAAPPNPFPATAFTTTISAQLTGPMCWKACRGSCSGFPKLLLLLPLPAPAASAPPLLLPAAPAAACSWKRSQHPGQRLKVRPSSWQVVQRYLLGCSQVGEEGRCMRVCVCVLGWGGEGRQPGCGHRQAAAS